LHFTRLRLHGFKTFVEPAELHIRAGLTGIVGPNGCGKSNLVESLRWAMGENSAKRMRGDEMDDVIFAGTSLRPSRNLAEVSLFLDNSDRSVTAEFNDSDEIVVTRRIERGAGSEYRINGKPVRQRDVQLLFTDQATGPHSVSIVGQGQIDAIIRAKPQDRRIILEEASGTAGLHARRHEAELKLKAAEQNLTRVDDVLNALDVQLRGLKQQARQASRFRNLAENIRRTEAALMRLRWMEAEDNAAKARDALQEAELRVSDLLAVVTRTAVERTDMAAALPGLRQTEAAAAAVLQRLMLSREQLEDEIRRNENAITAEESRLAQAREDYEREQARYRDGSEAIARLDAEKAELEAKIQSISESLPEKDEALSSTTAEAESIESALAELLESVAAAETRQQSLQQEIQALSERQAKLAERRLALEEQRAILAAEIASMPDIANARSEVEKAEEEAALRQDQAEQAEQARRDAEKALQEQRGKAEDARSRVTKLRAEAEAITAILQQQHDFEQVIDLITVAPGLESALAVAVGEALSAALNPEAAQHWRSLPPVPEADPLPPGTEALGLYIKAPEALERCISYIGLAASRSEGEAAAAHLRPGQIIVSRDGWAWRWDGFTVTPKAKTSAAIRLMQRNRLMSLKEEISRAEAEAQEEETALQRATEVFRDCLALDQETRASLQAAFAALGQARERLAEQEREAAAADARLTAISESLQHISADIAAVRMRANDIEAERERLPSIEALRLDISTKRAGLSELRDIQAKQQGELNGLLRERKLCSDRLDAVAGEISAWRERMTGAEEQSTALAGRITAIEQRLAGLHAKPAELEKARCSLLSELNEAEAARRKAADALIAAEQQLAMKEHQLKQEEKALGEAREERVRAESAVQSAVDHMAMLRERMAEKLQCSPEELAEIAALDGGANMPSIFELEQTLGRYLRERDNMGPVNLRASIEAQEVEEKIEKLKTEKEDLVAAIAKLRQGIAQLNREARERLTAAFGAVNKNFQSLFKRLFGGGRAYLELIDNEDPMNSGLEVFACPPGKKMQALSLLSGGECSLAALALLFAVFQTNPAPICVLDEAEAALDESNIDRFCSLIREIAGETSTRFLIVTHQRLTMAHMDRLYGVTMSEKGLSQLVSVDLESAVALRDGEEPETPAAAEKALADIQAA